MKIALLILILMIFCHIIADYNLQGWLASAKQKEWWEKNAPDNMYKNDYIMALFMHSFTWSFMIMVPAAIYALCMKDIFYVHFLWFIWNIGIHCFIDNQKANRKEINLVEDQLWHLLQIVLTWAGCVIPILF